MPELPEVETVRRGLEPAMAGARIVALELRRPDLRFPFPPGFAEKVAGRRIEALGRRAKYLLLHLDDDATILAHLGMSGSFRVEEETASETPGDFHHPRGKDKRHDHVVFHLEKNGAALRVIYNDPRRFGFMDWLDPEGLAAYPAFLALGPEPTGNSLGADYLAERLNGRSQPLKTVLLDQSVIAGLGNIYVCEALWRAGLSPFRSSGSLVDRKGSATPQLEALAGDIRQVIAEAIDAGGSSLRDHIRTDGTLGYFQHGFAVYDREDEPCRRSGCHGVITRAVQGGRSSFYCPVCQPAPKGAKAVPARGGKKAVGSKRDENPR